MELKHEGNPKSLLIFSIQNLKAPALEHKMNAKCHNVRPFEKRGFVDAGL